MPARSYWLIKSEPKTYSFAKLEADRRTAWEGVRNYEARNNLRAMKNGDLALYYHSGSDKAIVGVARVVREPYADPGDDTWTLVDFEPVAAMREPVTLAAVRAHKILGKMAFVKKGRISVTPVTPDEFKAALAAAKTKLPKG
jgi:predicted RNA-binding protein with PUA-like domain